MLKLGDDTLGDLPITVTRPTYDRAALRPGIVHVGLGNFHRAHQAWYLHRLMQQGLAQDWAIIGAGVRAPDAAMRDRLAAQDYLTTLIELDPDGMSVEVTGAMIDFLPVAEDNAPLIACMSDPAIRIVALTVTEGGYYGGPDGAFDLDHPDITHDIAHPATPRTVFGAIVAALSARRAAGAQPFTVQSCDNLQGNGDITRAAVLTLAQQTDAALADWIASNGAFPNSMVDCIVPATGPQELALVQRLGIDDAAPVTHENFRQWVIEDSFCAGRPPWEAVGATLTDDVHAFEAMKIRMLNAGHQVLANAGELLGIETISGCMAHADIAALFQKVQQSEIAPHVTAVPGMTPDAYITLISRRFANPEIHDTTRRVAFDGLSRHRGFIHPILRDALVGDTPIKGLALVEALWARMCAGTREDGSEIAPNDPEWDRLNTLAQTARTDPKAWLTLYDDLGDHAPFADAFGAALSQIWKEGTGAAIRAYLADT
ncbi:mannitol dehydrogenase family protein [Sulfitobacter albidus]|uniref:Mannitol dehydrogenase family protein n=1 Tax=Sulfitobacter albidus TaxID=2829501 RepID=A0A975PNP2_9RHOB|nr:mannitol dehydrogenase family protein [Sulfitobacter albidus]QUJ78062.1 mannitol dehydrogenase family protein [Sulfitobacter albidus]